MKITIIILGILFFIGILLPVFTFADSEFIDKEQIKNYLSIPENDSQQIIYTLIQKFNDELTDVLSSTNRSPREDGAIATLTQSVKLNSLKFLLIDAPVDIAQKVVFTTIKLARTAYGIKSLGDIIRLVETMSVRNSVSYLMNALTENDIRVASGALTMSFYSYKNNKQDLTFQYVITLKPNADKTAEVGVAILSKDPFEPPMATYAIPWRFTIWLDEGNTQIEPFIITITGRMGRGTADQYEWQGTPSITVDFPASVPDLGFRPESFWQRHLWEPLETKINDTLYMAKKLFPGIGDIVGGISQTGGAIKSAASFITAKISDFIHDEQKMAEITEITTAGFVNSPITDPETTPIVLPDDTDWAEVYWQKIKAIIEQIDNIAEQAELVLASGAIAPAPAEPAPQIGQTQQPNQENRTIQTEQPAQNNQANQQANQNEQRTDTSLGPAEPPVPSAAILISEVKTQSAFSSADEYIELYNPNYFSVTLSGWSLRKKTSSGSQTTLLSSGKFKGAIPALGYFVITPQSTTTGDIHYSSAGYSIAQSNSILLYDKQGNLVDQTGATIHPDYYSYGRKLTGGLDLTLKYQQTDLPSQDFETQLPTPGYDNQRDTQSPQLSFLSQPPATTTATSAVFIIASSEPECLFAYQIDQVAWQEKAGSTTSSLSINFKNLTSGNHILNIKAKDLVDNWSDVLGQSWQIVLPAPLETASLTGPATTSPATTTENATATTTNATSTTPLDTTDLTGQVATSTASTTTPATTTSGVSTSTPATTTLATTTPATTTPSANTTTTTATSTQGTATSTPATSTPAINTTTAPATTTPATSTPATSTATTTESNQKPTAIFVYSPQEPLSNEPMLFNGSYSSDPDGKIIKFFWTFSDGFSTTTQKPNIEHSFGAPGAFTAKLVVQDNQSAKSEPISITFSVKEGLASKLLITEIQIRDGSSSENDFVEIFNPAERDIDISGFQLKKKSSSGAEYSIRKFPSQTIIKAKTYFLWANANYAIPGGAIADVSSSQTISKDNGIALFAKSGVIIDQVAWGAGVNQFVEPTAFPDNPPDASTTTLTRRSEPSGNYQDTNNNSADFTLSSPTPTNSAGDTGNFLPPTQPDNFTITTIGQNNKNAALLAWQASADPDTASEKISYEIVCSSLPLDDFFLTGTTTDPLFWTTTTKSASMIIPGLFDNYTFYFALRSFDGLYYSDYVSAIYFSPWQMVDQFLATASNNRGAINLTWANNGAPQYVINYNGQNIVVNNDYSSGVIMATIEGLADGQSYDFSARALNASSTASATSVLATAVTLPGFQDNSDGTITDLYSGLMWVKDGAGAGANNGLPITWEQAKVFAENLVLCQNNEFIIVSTSSTTTCDTKYDDWRLPSFKEMAVLIKYQSNAPLIDQTFFQNIVPNQYWSSSYNYAPVLSLPHQYVKVVNFSNGAIDFVDAVDIMDPSQSPVLPFLPVRGISDIIPLSGLDEENQFGCGRGVQDNGDYTYTDLCSGLMWTDSGVYQGSYEGAIHSAFASDFAGHTDWRLPNLRELLLTTGVLAKGYSFTSHWTATQANSGLQWAVNLSPPMMMGQTFQAGKQSYFYAKFVREQ